ncbi:MAG: hypothetical protein K8M05_15515, partial [Deltaproteobacteria bacterium]|nr:hypothetical protein [Kofleriaceae bacterium]
EMHQRGRELARQWRQDGDRAKLEEAARLFKEAYKLAGSPLAECDLGLALHYLGEDGRAHARLTRCMPRLAAEGPDQVAAYRGVEDEVTAALRTGHVAVDIVTTPPGAIVTVSAFPDDETVIAPTLVWLAPGKHTFVARLAGHADASFEVDLTAQDVTTRARKEWRVRLDPAPAERAGVAPVVEPPPVVDTPRPRARSRTAAYATLATGGVLLGGGAVVHVLGRDVRSELATLSGQAYEDKLGTWQTYQRATIGLYAAGAVATGVGVWLYLRARTPAPLTVAPAAEGRGAMVWLFATR